MLSFKLDCARVLVTSRFRVSTNGLYNDGDDIFSPYTNMARYSLSRVIASTLRGAKANSRSLAKIPLPETKPATWRQDGATVKGSVTHSLYLLTPSKAIGQFQRLEPDATTRTPCFFSFFFFLFPLGLNSRPLSWQRNCFVVSSQLNETDAQPVKMSKKQQQSNRDNLNEATK